MDIVILRSFYWYVLNTMNVEIVSVAGAPLTTELRGLPLAEAKRILMEAGYTLQTEDSDAYGVTVSFTRNGPPTDPVVEVLRGRMNTTVSLQTSGGIVSGTLTMLGTDFAQLTEAGGSIVLVPYAQIDAVI